MFEYFFFYVFIFGGLSFELHIIKKSPGLKTVLTAILKVMLFVLILDSRELRFCSNPVSEQPPDFRHLVYSNSFLVKFAMKGKLH